MNAKDDSKSLLPAMLGQGVTVVNWSLVYEVKPGNMLLVREILICNTTGAAINFGFMVAPSSYSPVAGLNQPYVQVVKAVADMTSDIIDLVTAVSSSFKLWVYGSADDLNYHISGVPVQR